MAILRHHCGLVLFAVAALMVPRGASGQQPLQGDRPAEGTVSTRLDSYGDPLPAGAGMRMGTIRLRHTNSVNGVAFTPDGKTLVSCGWDHAIRLWDAESGRPLRQLLGTVDCGTFGVAFSQDGSKMASVGEQGLVRLWDLPSGKEIWKNSTNGQRVYGVAFAPDGNTFATAGSETMTRLWEVATGTELKTYESPVSISDYHAVVFSPDGKHLACGSRRQIQIYDLETDKRQVIKLKTAGEYFSLAFTADSKCIASGGRSPTLWNVETGNSVRNFEQPKKDSNVVAVSSDGNLLVAVGMTSIRAWKISNGELVHTISDYYNSFGPRTHAVAISPDNQTVATIGPHHVVMLWDLETGKRKLWFNSSHSERVESIACSPNEPIVASGACDGDVRLWSTETGKQLKLLSLGEKEPRCVHAVAFSPDGTQIAAGGYDWKNTGSNGLITTWKIEDGKQLWSTVVDGRVTSLDYSDDGKMIAAGVGLGNSFAFEEPSKPCNVNFLNSKDGKLQSRSSDSVSKFCTVKFLPGSKEAMLVGSGKAITVWNLADPETTKEFNADAHAGRIESAATSADGKILATNALFENLIVIWDTKTGSGIRQIEVEGGKGSKLAVSPDGKFLSAGSVELTNTDGRYHRSIQLWKIDSGEQIAKVDTERVGVSSLTFTPDGKKLISGMNDGTLLVWEVDTFKKQPAIGSKCN